MQLLDQALRIYHPLNYRRGIAITLQQMADIEILRQNWAQADRLLQRTLPVSLWMLNERGLVQVLEKLILVNDRLGNEQQITNYREQLEQLIKKNH